MLKWCPKTDNLVQNVFATLKVSVGFDMWSSGQGGASQRSCHAPCLSAACVWTHVCACVSAQRTTNPVDLPVFPTHVTPDGKLRVRLVRD